MGNAISKPIQDGLYITDYVNVSKFVTIIHSMPLRGARLTHFQEMVKVGKPPLYSIFGFDYVDLKRILCIYNSAFGSLKGIFNVAYFVR